LAIREYEFLPKIITKLQEPNIKLKKQTDLVEEALLKLNGFAKEKLQKCLSKNPDYKIFCYNDDFEHRKITEFAPIVSVDVERSFSQYKNLLSDNRQRFNQENIRMYHIIQYNYFLN
jgi:hypothetical protein